MYAKVEDTKPWYRQFWPWMLIALPGTAVVASIATYIIAASGTSGLVVDDYYKQGLAINRSLARASKAAELNLGANLAISDTRLRLMLDSEHVKPEQNLQLVFSHATFPELDQTVLLQGDSGNNYWSGEMTTALRTGKWYVYVSPTDDSWRLSGAMYAPTDSALELKPDL
ncbi:MAG: FixH family protein [Thiolinea sp.]